ncbi:TPA: hypothetical protein ACH3X1_009928 [Trebouxia sp. C0004]
MTRNQSSSDTKVGSLLHSITSDPVVNAIATGADAVPIKPKVRSLLERDYHDDGKQSKGKGRFEAGQSSSQGEGAAQANMLQLKTFESEEHRQA